ncbi:hypothetical protein CBR_g32133 [Chara braunii]|uniref:Uncharacterized protein n=1 Tax=Chara braunii TaxID=69332 RepID=A0A388JMX6_CHABU|nr:hypothetical protein CBR_g32133 [Chara braunii]|eukprot:GBG59115.1 hypothetical protein CBR_g32133 [Chara braunii]
MEAEPWSDLDDLVVDLEPGGSDEDRDDAPLTEMMRPRTRASSTGIVQPPLPPRPSSARDVPLQGPEDRIEGTISHPPIDCRGHDEHGSRGDAEEGDDEDYGVGRGYECNSEDDDDPSYSPTRRHGDDDDDDDDGDGTQPAEVATSPAQFAEVATGSAKVVALSTEVAGGSAEVAAASAEVVAASAETAIGSTEVDGVAAEVGRASAYVGDISSSMLREVAEETQGSLGQHEHVLGDDGGCRPAHEQVPESDQERTDGEERERALELARRCEMTQNIAASAREEQMLETGDGADHCTAEDAEVECGEELEWQAREDPLWADRRGQMDEASRRVMAKGPAYVSCSPSVPSSTTDFILPTHAEGPGPTPSRTSTPAGESPSPKSRKKKMRARKGLSTVRRVTHEMLASRPGLAGLHPQTREALGGDVVADAVGWRERTSTRGTEQPMSVPAEAAVPRPRGRTSTTATEEHDEHSRAPDMSMIGRILGLDVRALTPERSSQTLVDWESGMDDLEMPIDQRKRVSVYDLLRARGEVEEAAQGGTHASDTVHGPVGGTSGGDGTTSVAPQRRRKDIVDDDDA